LARARIGELMMRLVRSAALLLMARILARRQGLQGVAFTRILRFTDAHAGQLVTQARGDPGG
jgi:hypothetical protein